METTAAVEPEVQSGAPAAQDGEPKENKGAGKLFPHEQMLKDSGFAPEKLPTDIKMSINAWNMQMRKYKKTPSNNLIEGMKKTSIKIADAIQSFIEKDLPEKTEEQIQKEKDAVMKAQREKEQREKEQREREQREREQRELQAKERERLEMLRKQKERREQELKRQQEEEANAPERKVMEIINAKGKIHYKELKEILGQNVGDSVRVGSLVLLNVPFTNSYKLYKQK